MQIKKSPKADLQNFKGLFLEIGLIISLLITIGAFLYAPKEYRIEQVDLQYAPIEEEIEEDQPFIKVEKMPTFRGGDLNQFRNWVQGRLRYPQIAQENGISGRVTLSFVVERDGSVTNIQVLQSPDRSLAEEATRVVGNSPKWEPGMQSNKPVRVKYTLPVVFTIQN